jgi:DNA-binding MarR family transcriptional regulator
VIAIAEPIDADVLRARNEFLSRPGLHASAAAIAAALDVTSRHAASILDSMLREGFLERTVDEQYVRTGENRRSS